MSLSRHDMSSLVIILFAVVCEHISYYLCFAFMWTISIALDAGGCCIDFVVVIDGNDVMKPTVIDYPSVDKTGKNYEA